MKTAFIYTGQGSQYPGMGKEFLEQSDTFAECIEKASIYAGLDIKDIMQNADEATLSDTEIIQPVMAAFALGVTRVLSEKGIKPDITAGLSLGEYPALFLSGVFDEKTLIELTAFRGREMKKCAAGACAKMYAVLGAESEEVEALCEEIRQITGELLAISNYNCKGQNVVAGLEKSADMLAAAVKERGLGKCIPLKVSSAFHTELMAEASKALRDYFANVTFGEMNIPVVFNVTGRPLAEEENVAGMLERQVMSPVKMRQTIEYMAKHGVERIIEVGPGKTIAGFVKRTAPGIQASSVNVPDDISALLP